MDPNACWEMICAYLNNRRAMDETERAGLEEACVNLRVWLSHDGFLPDAIGPLNKHGLVRVLRAVEMYVKKF